MKQDIGALLRANSYPGRGIVIGRTADGAHMAMAYFIMGRSENSRNRIFVEDGGGLRTRAFDETKLTDPSLVIYAPVRVLGSGETAVTIVTNGDQTDTVYDAIATGRTFEDALRTRKFEPDPPIYTPRISGKVEDMRYKLSILKSANGNPEGVLRFFYEYRQPVPGEGHFIHTYLGDGDPVQSFRGEPHTVAIGDDLDAFTSLIWDNLNEQNKVSLFTRFIDIATGCSTSRIINKNK